MVVKFPIDILFHVDVFPERNFEVLSNVQVMLNNTFIQRVSQCSRAPDIGP
jgi:hypothetical protein